MSVHSNLFVCFAQHLRWSGMMHRQASANQPHCCVVLSYNNDDKPRLVDGNPASGMKSKHAMARTAPPATSATLRRKHVPIQQLMMCSGVSPASSAVATALGSAPCFSSSFTRGRQPGPALVRYPASTAVDMQACCSPRNCSANRPTRVRDRAAFSQHCLHSPQTRRVKSLLGCYAINHATDTGKTPIEV